MAKKVKRKAKTGKAAKGTAAKAKTKSAPQPKSMAKSKTAGGKSNGKPRGKKHAATGLKIEDLARSIVAMAQKMKDPAIEIPIRSLSNIDYNEKTRHVEMGSNKQSRNFFNYGQSKRFMQTLLVASKCKELIDIGKTASIRQIYYMSKHSIKGTSEKTFDDQAESDPIIEDLEVAINSLREELHVFASNRGNLAGPIVLVDDGSTLDCAAMGSAGYAVPSICEESVIQFKKCSAKFILHVEKDTVWRRFHEDRFWEKNNCIVSHGGGQPARGMRRLLRRMHEELKLPVFVLLDNDPWGYYIYSVIKHGSINLAYESKRMAIPDAKFIGVSSFDYERCGMSDDVKIELDDSDIKRAKQIANYKWFMKKKPWQKEIKKMMKNGFKMEVEAMISKDLSYLCDEYVPMKLKDKKQWLD